MNPTLKTPLTETALEEKLLATVKKITAPLQSGTAAKIFEGCGFDRQKLGALLEVIEKYAKIRGEEIPAPPRKHTIICCADHGVYAEGVSAYPQATTYGMVRNYLVAKGAVANALSNYCHSPLTVVDLGINFDASDIPGLLDRRIASGTKNSANGPAMTRLEALEALVAGIELAESAVAEGALCLLPGEMGISNTTSSAAIVAAVCGMPAELATGRGTNISDERLAHKKEVVRRILAANPLDKSDGVAVLSHLGGFELGAISGIILGAAANRAFVILDGFNTGAAALIAATIAPPSVEYLMTSHLGGEPGHRATLKYLKLTPYMDLQFRLGEATGSSIASRLIDIMAEACSALAEFSPEANLSPKLPCNLKDVFAPKKQEQFNSIEEAIAADRAKIKPLDEDAMAACQYYIDNLTKPIRCCGKLEDIAVKIAGITGNKKPPRQMSRAIVRFSRNVVEIDPALDCLTNAFAKNTDTFILPCQVEADTAPLANYRAGRDVVARLNEYDVKIFGIAADDTLDADSPAFKAVLQGSFSAAAELRSLAVLDDPTTENAAKDVIPAIPETAPFILHVQPEHFQLDAKVKGGIIAALGFTLIDAALYMLNDMKTFADAGVAVAEDGLGAGIQKDK